MILGDEQLEALNTIESFILNSGDTAINLMGSGGTGKTTVTKELITWLEDKGIDYCLCAPTHKAKAVLEYFSGREALTLHKLLALSPKLNIIELDFRTLLFRSGECSKNMPYKGLVIVDEASMISDDLFDLLIRRCKENKCKILFILDPCQLKPVKSDNKSKVCFLNNSVQLTKIYRQSSKNSILDTLQTLRETFIPRFKECKGEDGSLLCTSNFNEFFNWCKSGIKTAIDNKNIFESKVLAFTNARVNNYNNYLKKLIFGEEKEYYNSEIITAYENLEFEGYEFWNSMDYLIIDEPAKIDTHIPRFMKLPVYRLNLYDTGNKSKCSINILSSEIDDNTYADLAKFIDSTRINAIEANSSRNRGKLWGLYYELINSFTTPRDLFWEGRLIRKKSFDRGYSITVHKAQGSTLNNVYIDMRDIFKCKDMELLRQLQYVALSRTKHNVYLFQ
jgi:ATP-dependent exoDNAse (exonuclease V) alpha subunit